jgi:hypothetical protein
MSFWRDGRGLSIVEVAILIGLSVFASLVVFAVSGGDLGFIFGDGKKSIVSVSDGLSGSRAMPVARADEVFVHQGTLQTFPAATFLANDTPPTGLSVSAVGEAAGGDVSLDQASQTVGFLAKTAAGRAASFRYTVIDSVGNKVSALVTATVLPALPTVRNHFLSVYESGRDTLISAASLLDGAAGDQLKLATVAAAGGGEPTLNVGSQVVDFLPSADLTAGATVSFSYAAVDANGQMASGFVTATAVAYPTVVDDGSSTSPFAVTKNGALIVISLRSLLVNDRGTGLTIVAESVTGARHGTLGVTAAAIIYTPVPGSVERVTDSFTYRAKDVLGTVSEPGTVTLELRPALRASVAGP